MRLSDEEAGLFYEAWGALLWWVNQHKELGPPLPLKPGLDNPIPAARAAKVRDVLWEDADLIRKFVADNPADLSPGLLELVASLAAPPPGKLRRLEALQEAHAAD